MTNEKEKKDKDEKPQSGGVIPDPPKPPKPADATTDGGDDEGGDGVIPDPE